MKTALITGASGGIGKATVIEYIKNGYFVIGQYNKGEEGINSLKSELEKLGLIDFFFAKKCDFAKEGEALAMCQRISKSFKHINALVLNAGAGLYKLYTQTTYEEWQTLFNVNLNSAFVISNYFLPEMISRNSGNIIFVSSVWGQQGASMEVCYSATKSALIGLTKSLAKEVAPSGVRVNCVCPGFIDTPINARLSKSEVNEVVSQIPLNRIGNPQEVAKTIYFLTSEQASYITGQQITIDGGWTL